MGKDFFDYDDGAFAHTISDNMAMDSDGNFLMRMGDNMVIDMDAGEVHMISGWPNDESDDEDDDEYEYVDENPRFRPGRIILGIISLLAFGFCIYKGFVTGLSTSGADVTSAPGMNYVIVALCMLVTALLYFIMNNRDTLFAFLIPMIVYIGSAVFAFLKHGDEFELLILAGVSGVLAVISLILAIASRGGDDYDDEDDYDDPFEEEHDN